MTGQRSTVMIVTQSAVERSVFTDRFFAAGYKVADADSAEEAIRKAVRVRPRALVVEDHLLPPEQLATFASLPTLHTTKVFLLMHALSPDSVRAYLDAGAATVFLRRAHTPRDIVRIVHKALSL